MTTKYAIVYLSVPLTTDGAIPAPEEEDASAVGNICLLAVQSATPLAGVELIGTRLQSNNLLAPGVTRFPIRPDDGDPA